MEKALRLVAGRGAALLLAAAFAAYALVWLSASYRQPALDLGFKLNGGSLEVLEVLPDSMAEELGLKTYDSVVAIEGVEIASPIELHDAVCKLDAGDYLRITVRMAALDRLRSFDIPLVEPQRESGASWLEAAAGMLASSYPLLLLAIALPVLLRRPDSIAAWLWCCGTLGVAVALLPLSFLDLPPQLRGTMFAFRALFGGLGPALLFAYFAGFPSTSPIVDRFPQLREAAVGTAAVGGLFAAVWSLSDPQVVLSTAGSRGAVLMTLWLLAGFALCLTALVGNFTHPASEKDARVLEWNVAGAAVGLPLLLLMFGWSKLSGQSIATLSYWLWMPSLLASLLFPAALSYAIGSDDPEELPDATRAVGRWLLVGSGSAALWTLLGALLIAPLAEVIHASGARITAAAVGVALLATWYWIGWRLRPAWVDAVDRRLFSDIHRRRTVLRSATGAIDAAQNVAEITRALAEQIRDAVQPSSLAIYLAEGPDRLVVHYGDVGKGMEHITLDEPLPLETRHTRNRTIGEMRDVVDFGPDCLIPIRGESAGLQGLIALGPHASDAPYSTEERQLLMEAAGHAATAINRLTTPDRAAPWSKSR